MSRVDRIKRFIRSCRTDEVIPDDAPWWYRWNWVGLRAWLRYFHLSILVDREAGDVVSSRTLCAAQAFRAAKFACIFGSPGNAMLRALTREAEHRKIASRQELHCLVRYHDLWNCPDGGVRLRVSAIAALLGLGTLAIVLISGLLVLALFATAAIPLSWKIALIAGALLGYGTAGWIFYDCSIRPWRIAQRLQSDIESLIRNADVQKLRSGFRLLS